MFGFPLSTVVRTLLFCGCCCVSLCSLLFSHHCHSYQQHFDLEGESGVVVRGVGTAVTTSRVAASAARNTSPSSGQEVGQNDFQQIP